MTHSESTTQLARALSAAQGQFLVPKKTHRARIQTKSGGSYEYDYSTLDDLLAAVRAGLTANGLAVVQNTLTPANAVAVTTRLMHTSGEWMESDPIVLTTDGTPQNTGACITYARRYSLSAFLNVAAEDDKDATEGQTRRIREGTEPAAAKPRAATPAAKPNGAEQAQAQPAAAKPAQTKPASDVRVISEAQIKRLFAIAKVHGVPNDTLKKYLGTLGIEHTNEIKRSDYDSIIAAIQDGVAGTV